MSGETKGAREAIDRMIQRERTQAETTKQPFDSQAAKERARKAAIRDDYRNKR